MLLKASILATVVVAATVTLTQVDFRDLYNEMYPVNGLKRDVLGLCHKAQSTFIRAIRSDREDCYDSMPDSVEQAIGWVRTSSLLAELNNKPTAIETAERLLSEQVRTGRLGVTPQFTGFIAPTEPARPCPSVVRTIAPVAPADPRAARPGEKLARRVTGNDQAALTALGMAPRGSKPGSKAGELPALPLNAAAPPLQDTTGCKV